MSVSIKDYTPTVRGNIQRSANLFLRFFADEVHRIAEPVTPKKHGPLRRSVLKQVLGLKGSIKWLKRYAAVQELGERNGIKFKKYTTAGTGKKYAENSIHEAVRRENKIMRRARLI
jgi:hypothetical protein